MNILFEKKRMGSRKLQYSYMILSVYGRGPRVVVSNAAFHARARGSVPGLGGLKETKMFLPHPRVKLSIVWSLRDQEVACSASDRQGSNFESCVWRTVSSHSSHHPQEVLLAQFSRYVHIGAIHFTSMKEIYILGMKQSQQQEKILQNKTKFYIEIWLHVQYFQQIIILFTRFYE